MSAAIECLLVGGPADGRRMFVKGNWNEFEQAYTPQQVIEIEQLPKLEMCTPQAWPPEPTNIQRYYYQCHQFHEDGHTFWIYTPSGSRDSIMAALIAGYRQGGAA